MYRHAHPGDSWWCPPPPTPFRPTRGPHTLLLRARRGLQCCASAPAAGDAGGALQLCGVELRTLSLAQNAQGHRAYQDLPPCAWLPASAARPLADALLASSSERRAVEQCCEAALDRVQSLCNEASAGEEVLGQLRARRDALLCRLAELPAPAPVQAADLVAL